MKLDFHYLCLNKLSHIHCLEYYAAMKKMSQYHVCYGLHSKTRYGVMYHLRTEKNKCSIYTRIFLCVL